MSSPMCGRFVSSSTPDEIANYFDAQAPAEAAVEPNFNVAPTTDVFVVLEDVGIRRLARHHWGLVPFWAKDPSVGNRMINARSEGLASKNAFRNAYRKRRCIVPVDGFYEWKKIPGQRTKQPYFIHRPDDEPMALAGLWEEWRAPGGGGDEREVLRSTTIVTTTPNDPMSATHDRMPVILPANAWAEWLDADNADVETLSRLLVPAPPEIITMHPVSTEVGNVRNRGEHLVESVPEPTETPSDRDR